MTRRAVGALLFILLLAPAREGSGASAGAGVSGAGAAGKSVAARGWAPLRRAGVLVEVLGIRVGMREADAHRVLAPLGTRREIESEEAERGAADAMERELWTLRGGDLAYLALGVGEGGRVLALQAYARPGARALRYRDVGDPGQAKRLGYYIYDWVIAAEGDAPGLRIEARGTDPEYLGSVSIVRERAARDGGGVPRDGPAAAGVTRP